MRAHFYHLLLYSSSLHPPLHCHLSSPIYSLLHFFTLPSSLPLSPSYPPCQLLFWRLLTGRSAGQDPGRTSAVFSLDKCRHCESRRKSMSHLKVFHYTLIIFIMFLFYLSIWQTGKWKLKDSKTEEERYDSVHGFKDKSCNFLDFPYCHQISRAEQR